MKNEILELGLTSGESRVEFCPTMLVQFASPEESTSSNSLYLDSCAANWVIEATKKLDALARLQAGWDSYGGRVLQPHAKRLTMAVLQWLRTVSLPVPAVILGSGGTVHLEWKSRGKELEVELGESKGFDFVKVSPGGEIEEGEAKGHLSQRVRDLTDWLRES